MTNSDYEEFEKMAISNYDDLVISNYWCLVRALAPGAAQIRRCGPRRRRCGSAWRRNATDEHPAQICSPCWGGL